MTSQQSQTEANKAIIRRYREAHNQNNMDVLDDIVAADLTSHSHLPNVPPGREGGKMVHQGSLASFPDGHTTTNDLIAEGDKVVVRRHAQGRILGHPGDRQTDYGHRHVDLSAHEWQDRRALGRERRDGLVDANGRAAGTRAVGSGIISA